MTKYIIYSICLISQIPLMYDDCKLSFIGFGIILGFIFCSLKNDHVL